MSDSAVDDGLFLDDLLDDLKIVVETVLDGEESDDGPVTYESVKSSVNREIELHLIDYVNFLEDEGLVEYDRGDGILSSGRQVGEALDAPPEWVDSVRREFNDVLVDADEGLDAESIPDLSDEAEFDWEDELDEEFDDSGFPDEGLDESDLGDAEAPEGDFPDDPGLDDGFDDSGFADDAVSDSGFGDDSDFPEDSLEDSGLPGDSDSPDNSLEESSFPDEAGFPEDSLEDSGFPDDSDFDDSDFQEVGFDESSVSVEVDEAPEDEPLADDTSDHNANDNTGTESTMSTDTGNRYERLDEIGSGGVGTVFHGRHVGLDRDVAIKEISNIFDVFADLQRDDIVERFQEITQTQARISHPAIVQIFDIETGAEYPYVVTEYAPQGNLRQMIDDDENRSLRIALKYFIQILHGLNAAHEQGVVHGSIKPENVVRDAAGNAKLCDFGLSTLVDLGSDASNQVYVGVGAVAYMAPEQFQDPTAATVQSDIYSLGIMFYEMLTGKVPGRRSPMPSSFYPEIPRKLDDIFDQMSMDAQEDRYQSVEDVLTDFYGADEIIQLLDRQSGVVFLRDPLEYGDEPLVDESPQSGTTSTETADEPTPGEQQLGTRNDTRQMDRAQFEEEHAEEPGGDDAQDEQEEPADSPEPAEEADRQEEAELEGAIDEESEADDADSDDAPTPEAADGEDDEVLDKLDEYGELFEE